VAGQNDNLHVLAFLKVQTEITIDQTAIDVSIREVESIHTGNDNNINIKGSTWGRILVP